MKEHIPVSALRHIDRARKTYWKVFKPETYGVKGLVFHPEDSDRILVVRHSYGNTNRINLPGGGYKPRKETPEQAIRRELLEEVDLALDDDVIILDRKESRLEGKRDKVTFLGARALSEILHPNSEIAEAMWVPTDLSNVPEGVEISRFIQSTLDAHSRYISSDE